MKPRTRFIVVAFLIVLAGVSPILCAIGAGTIAEAHGCEFNEAGAYPCVFLGHDFGELLADLGVMGWASLVTIPAAIGALGFWSLIALLQWGARRRTARKR